MFKFFFFLVNFLEFFGIFFLKKKSESMDFLKVLFSFRGLACGKLIINCGIFYENNRLRSKRNARPWRLPRGLCPSTSSEATWKGSGRPSTSETRSSGNKKNSNEQKKRDKRQRIWRLRGSGRSWKSSDSSSLEHPPTPQRQSRLERRAIIPRKK